MKDKNYTGPIDMAYNTQQTPLIMPEYGRNVQQLVRHAQQIEDRDMRQAFCEEIINLIQQLYPQSKNVEDYREKLWQHLFQIAEYNLDATTPSGVVPTPEAARKRPDLIPYPMIDTRFKHYGNNVQRLINKAEMMDEGAIKEGFVQTIGSYMKLAYRTWNKEHYVSDEIIKTDLATLSHGKLSLEEDSRLDGLSNATRVRRDNNNSNNKTNAPMMRSNNNRDTRQNNYDDRQGYYSPSNNRPMRDSRNNPQQGRDNARDNRHPNNNNRDRFDNRPNNNPNQNRFNNNNNKRK